MAMNTRLAIKTKQNQNLLYIKRKLHLKLLVSIWFKRWHTYYFYSFKNWDNTSWKLAGNRLNGLIWQSYLCECRVSFRKCIIFEIIYMWDHLPVIKFDLVNLINFLYMHFGQHIFSQIKRGGGEYEMYWSNLSNFNHILFYCCVSFFSTSRDDTKKRTNTNKWWK